MPSLRGRGIKESVDKRLNTRPKAITTFLKTHGHEIVKRIIVCRSPLAQSFIKIGQILTLGDWNKQQQKLGYYTTQSFICMLLLS